MSWLYKNLIRPTLFTRDSEEIHNFTLDALSRLARHPLACDAFESFYAAPPLPMPVAGMSFPNPVGLAAGMDKRAAALPLWERLGFGFCEVGGVTWHEQPGNPQPRMFRAVADEALVNRMGFNNAGAEKMALALAEWRRLGLWPRHPVGINLGKSKITPLEAAAGDYANSFRALWDYVDFFVVNVSSPNTPNLRQLQDKAALSEILSALQEINRELGQAGQSARPTAKPLWIKVAPDLTFSALDEILELVSEQGVTGIVAANTTIARPETKSTECRAVYAETGGLSGKPLRARSTEVIRHLYTRSNGTVPIIGVGGIFTARDAWEKITAGASLVQVYTGLVFEGPSITQEIVSGLAQLLAERGFRNLREAVGCAARAGAEAVVA